MSFGRGVGIYIGSELVIGVCGEVEIGDNGEVWS